MLILSRRPGEQIVIEGNIRLSVIAVRGGQVRLGIAAPQEIPVDRKEVRDRWTKTESTGIRATG
jgi:carbon storage regulator